MANYVKISTLGPRPFMEKPQVGQAAVERMINFWRDELAQVLPDRPDLIVLPEACDRFPAHSPEERRAYYRVRGEQVLRFLADTAKEHNCYIAYSAARELPDGTWRNSTQLIGRDGQVVGIYNKNHPTIGEMEWGILAGRSAPILQCDFGRVGCAICFDLNFDQLRQKYVQSGPDLILFSSMYHGGLMQGYWAYSCRAHLVTSLAGLPCAIISPVGHTLAHTTNYFHFVTTTVNLDCKVLHLDFNWERLTAMKQKYGSRVSLYDPGHLGAVLISSESDEFSSDDLVQEFGFELLDDYLSRSLSCRRDPQNMEPA